jgi:hypothetical protein
LEAQDHLELLDLSTLVQTRIHSLMGTVIAASPEFEDVAFAMMERADRIADEIADLSLDGSILEPHTNLHSALMAANALADRCKIALQG